MPELPMGVDADGADGACCNFLGGGAGKGGKSLLIVNVGTLCLEIDYEELRWKLSRKSMRKCGAGRGC